MTLNAFVRFESANKNTEKEMRNKGISVIFYDSWRLFFDYYIMKTSRAKTAPRLTHDLPQRSSAQVAAGSPLRRRLVASRARRCPSRPSLSGCFAGSGGAPDVDGP